MADDDGMDTSAYSMDDLREGLKYLEEIPQALIITNLSESVFLKPDHPDSRQVGGPPRDWLGRGTTHKAV